MLNPGRGSPDDPRFSVRPITLAPPREGHGRDAHAAVHRRDRPNLFWGWWNTRLGVRWTAPLSIVRVGYSSFHPTGLTAGPNSPSFTTITKFYSFRIPDLVCR